MAALTGQKRKDTYKDLLQVSNSNAGIDATLRAVSDGEGTASKLSLSTTAGLHDGVFDFNGNEVTLDADGDSGIVSDTDDRIDLKLQGSDLFRFDGSVASVINGLDFIASAAAADIAIKAVGTDTNIDIDIQPKGSGKLLIGGSAALINMVEDTTPQLGGDLDLNGKNIDFPTTANVSDCLDEDNMASDSATVLATQQSIKAYVDAGDAAAASQAEQEAASSTTVFTSPGRQHFHPGHPKAWIHFDQTGTLTNNADYGVASLTDTAVGRTTITFDTAFSSVNYAVVVSGEQDASVQTGFNNAVERGSQAAGSVIIECRGNASLVDRDNVYVACFGDL